jgi:hypothetical protein
MKVAYDAKTDTLTVVFRDAPVTERDVSVVQFRPWPPYFLCRSMICLRDCCWPIGIPAVP